MILQASYRDDMIDLIHQEPESTFSDLNTTKKAVLDNYALLNQMWPLYQKAVEEYEDGPWLAMSQALIDCVKTCRTPVHADDPELKPNEFYGCGFYVNTKGKFSIDLYPTLGVLCSDKHTNVNDALNESPSTPKYYFRIYNKNRTAFLAKKYSAFSIYTFKNRRACYEKYNQLIQTELDHYRDIVARLAVKSIPEDHIDICCN